MTPKEISVIWQEFAAEKNGEYLPIHNDRVLVPCENYDLFIDNYVFYAGTNNSYTEFTRAFVEFEMEIPYELLIFKESWIDKIGKLFGAKDVQVGNELFDKSFMIKSDNEAKTILLLNSKVKDLLLRLHPVRFEISQEEGLWKEKAKPGKWMLYLVVEQKVKDKKLLELIYNLYSETLVGLKNTSRLSK